jgi:P4 family phage/plasmid primase-like protien
MTKNNFLIYGLSLIEGKYYIGKTENLDRRFQEHTEGTATSWTKLYPPISKPIVLKYKADIFDENLFFKKYVLQYGLENVRGDIYCQINLSPQDIKHLNKELDSANNSCYSCHQIGHFISTCPNNISTEKTAGKPENINHSDKSASVSFNFIKKSELVDIYNNNEKMKSNRMKSLKEFLDKYSVNKQQATNVTSMDGKWGGKWLVPKDKYDEFLRLYSEAVINNNLKLVEKKTNINEYFRFYADIDISEEDIAEYFKGNLPRGLLKMIINTYQEAVSVIFGLDISSAQAIITTRIKPSAKMHLHWPNIIVNNVHARLVRDYVIKNLDMKMKGNWTKWLDSAVYTCTGLRMLGSLKPSEKPVSRYYIFKGIDENNQAYDPHNTLTLDDIKTTSICVVDPNIALNALSETGKQLLNENEKGKKLIRVIPKERNEGTNVSNEEKSLTKIQQACIEEGFTRSWTTAHYPQDLLKYFSLGPIKVIGDNYYTMMNKNKLVCPIKGAPHNRECSCNYHVMGPDGTYLKCHDELCQGKRYPNTPIPLADDIKQILYININNNGTINNTVNNKMSGVKNLESTQQLDFWNDLEVIQVFNNKDKDLILLKALNGGEASMAELLKVCSSDRFNYTRESGWWYWNDVHWCKESSELVRFLYRGISPIISQARESYKFYKEDRKIEQIKEKISQIDIVLKKLETRDYKQKIIGEASWIFEEDSVKNLVDILDTNPYLIGFPNGVYDIHRKEFRAAKADDYVSIIMPYEYNSYVDNNAREQLENFLKSIMPDNDDRCYMLKLLSTGLLGSNPNELFHIFTGSGRNGKSKLTELIKLTLGEYYESISSSFLTAKISAPGQATPHLMALRKKRLIIGSEPDHQFKLNATLIKSLSGNDEIVGRQLYSETKSFRPFFKMILLCNNIPEIDSVDKAVWRRCRCLSFPTSFVLKPELPHEQLIDEQLSEKLSKWRLPFFQLLLEYYDLYKNEGLNMTPSMLERTRDYQVASDVYLEWLINRTETSDNNIHTANMYEDFNNWYHENYRGKKHISQADFVKGIGLHKEIKKSIRVNGIIKRGVEKLSLKNSTTRTTPT